MPFEINMYFIAFIVVAILLIVFSYFIHDWIMRRRKQSEHFLTARNGALINIAPNMVCRVREIKNHRHAQGNKFLLVAQRDDGAEITRTVGQENIRLFSLKGSLIDVNRLMFVCNVDNDGGVVDDYMGLDWVPSKYDSIIDRQEAEIISLRKLIKELSVEPLDKQRYFELQKMTGDIIQQRESATKATGTNIVLSTAPMKDEQNEGNL